MNLSLGTFIEFDIEYEFHFQIAFKNLKMLNSLTKNVDIFGRGLHTPLK